MNKESEFIERIIFYAKEFSYGRKEMAQCFMAFFATLISQGLITREEVIKLLDQTISIDEILTNPLNGVSALTVVSPFFGRL